MFQYYPGLHEHIKTTKIEQAKPTHQVLWYQGPDTIQRLKSRQRRGELSWGRNGTQVYPAGGRQLEKGILCDCLGKHIWPSLVVSKLEAGAKGRKLPVIDCILAFGGPLLKRL